MINILHSGNASLYAAKNYDNPGCTDVLEFYDDLKSCLLYTSDAADE